MADETKPETIDEESFFAVRDAVPEPVAPLDELFTPVAPVVEEPKPEPVVAGQGYYYNGHEVRFSESGDCFIAKGGHCLGLPRTVIPDTKAAKAFIDAKGE